MGYTNNIITNNVDPSAISPIYIIEINNAVPFDPKPICFAQKVIPDPE